MKDVHLRMSPCPDQVHEHHDVAAVGIGEEMEPEVTVQQQHRQRRRQDGEGRDDQQVGSECRPAEHRHAHIGHARRVHLQDRGDEVDAGQQRPDAGDLQRPKIIIDPDAGRVGDLGQRRIRQPPGARELAHDEGNVDEQGTRGGEPQADRVQRRERNVANAKLQRHDEVHQPDHERHGDEEDHQRAVGREDLVVMLRRQVALGPERQRLLRPHHDRVAEAAQQHDHRQHGDMMPMRL